MLPIISVGQEYQMIKGKSVIKRINYSNTKAVKLKKINSDIKIENIEFDDINKNNILDFGEEGILKCVLSNNSDDTLKSLQLKISSDKVYSKILFPEESIVDIIEPKGILELSIPIKNNNVDEYKDSILNLNFTLMSDDIVFSEDNNTLELMKKGSPAIDILYDYTIKDTLVKYTEHPSHYLSVSLKIVNTGTAPLFSVKGMAKLIYTGGYIISDDEEYIYDFINQGEEKELKFDLIVDPSYSQEVFPITFKILGNNNLFKYSGKIEMKL